MFFILQKKKKVKSVLEDEKKMEELGEIGKDTIEEYKNKNKNKTEKELEECKRLRLEALLKEAKIEANSNSERIPIYEEVLAMSRGGFGIVYKRDISETYVNIYNKEWLTVWDANMDLQLCFDFYAIITYISDYYTKDDSGTLKYIKDVLKDATEDLKSKLRLVMNAFLTHRQIGESEVYYRILPSLKLKSANTESKFLLISFKKNRSVFHERLEDEKAKYCEGAIKIDGKEGFFIERLNLIDKFQRRDLDEYKTFDQLTYIQFGKFYK